MKTKDLFEFGFFVLILGLLIFGGYLLFNGFSNASNSSQGISLDSILNGLGSAISDVSISANVSTDNSGD
jgi:hypothetical protein